MKLSELLNGVKISGTRGSLNVPIRDIRYDSRKVEPGCLFVAISGFKSDGRAYIPDAVKRGAAAVVFQGPFFDNLEASQVRIAGSDPLAVRSALSRLSSNFFGHPTEDFYLAGITGTNGKTTLTYLLEALWQKAGHLTGVVGTVNTRYGKTVIPAEQTTPESRDLEEIFATMSEKKVSRVAMEVSSHALALERATNLSFDAAVFTNLTRDHLDFHKTMKAYASSKEKFFTQILKKGKKGKVAVINTDDKYGAELIGRLKAVGYGFKAVGYGLKKGSEVTIRKLKVSIDGLRGQLITPEGPMELNVPLIGKFNAQNVLAAAIVASHSGMSWSEIAAGLLHFKGVPGRMERFLGKKGQRVFVDYAHTPDALKNVLGTLRAIAPRRVFTVFGCGGDRDPGKRPKMGFEAARFSDVCLVTSDNPRTEDPGKIIAAILPGVKKGGLGLLKGGRGYQVIPDRKKAIEAALNLAGPEDVVLVAGKGHEDYQIIGTAKRPFSDQKVIKAFT